MSIPCFLLVPTGFVRVYAWEGDQRILKGTCKKEDFGVEITGSSYEPLYKRQDTGEETSFRDAPAGAMVEFEPGSGLTVKLPNNRTWNIDSRASNCDSPCKNCGVPYKDHRRYTNDTEHTQGCDKYEDARPHKCWIRHGEPPQIHVDKNGVTCNAGAGSILAGDYHGFLHNGCLVPT